MRSKFGPELPGGAPDLVVLADLPPEVARLESQFKQQERWAWGGGEWGMGVGEGLGLPGAG